MANSATATQRADHAPNYNKVAWFYELSSALYSGGLIRKSKQDQIGSLQPGDRILYLGVGSGEDALLAARAGAQVTCIDLSSSMIKRARRKLEREGLQAEWLVGDALQFQAEEPFDHVALNYFLNCFQEHAMRRMLEHSASLVREGGQLMIADVARAEGNLLYRLFNQAYLKLAMLSYWTLGLVPWHENYDYARYFAGTGLELKRRQTFRWWGLGPVLFQNLVATRTFC